MMDKLKSASGADFDKTFAKDMLADHEKDIAEVKEARDKTTDAKLKSLLSATLPVLEKHRDLAQKLVDKGASASASGTQRRTRQEVDGRDSGVRAGRRAVPPGQR